MINKNHGWLIWNAKKHDAGLSQHFEIKIISDILEINRYGYYKYKESDTCEFEQINRSYHVQLSFCIDLSGRSCMNR